MPRSKRDEALLMWFARIPVANRFKPVRLRTAPTVCGPAERPRRSTDSRRLRSSSRSSDGSRDTTTPSASSAAGEAVRLSARRA